jgi:hypothetical protein
VQFGVGATDVGAAVAISAGGVATTTTTFAAAGTQTLWAVVVPASGAYAAAEATLSLVVNPGTAGSVPVALTVPATGALTVTVAPGTVTLAEQGTTPPATATGTLNDVTGTDSRNTYPGWSVSGQMSSFTDGGSAAIPGDQLGWTPTAVGALTGGATLGPTVAPGTSPDGIGEAAQVLASAPSGQGLGSNTLSADLTLDIPPSTPAGAYSGALTVTYLELGPVQVVVTF